MAFAVPPAGGQYFGPDGVGEQRGHPKLGTSSEASYDVAAQRRLWRCRKN